MPIECVNVYVFFCIFTFQMKEDEEKECRTWRGERENEKRKKNKREGKENREEEEKKKKKRTTSSLLSYIIFAHLILIIPLLMQRNRAKTISQSTQ